MIKNWFTFMSFYINVLCSYGPILFEGATEKCGSGKCGSIGRRAGKCRSRLAVWKAEPILYSDTALSYFLKIVYIDF